MVTEGELNPTIKLFPAGKAPIIVDIFSQGGGRRGAATSGFLFGLSRFEDIVIEGMSGTSAGAMANAVHAHGLAKEIITPQQHNRQDTRILQANLYQVVTECSPYNVVQTMVEQTHHTMRMGQNLLATAPFAALRPMAFIASIGALGQGIEKQFHTYGQALTRATKLHGKKHILELILEDVIGNTKSITHPSAPLLVDNVVRMADGKELLLHNRNPMTLKHVTASGALTAYLPTIHVPGIGECRDGAEGGANPPLLDFYRLKKEILPNAKATIGILYNLSDPDGSLKEELKARDPKLHAHFIQAMHRQKQEREALQARGHDLRIVQAALTREQRQESLSDTNPDKMRAMFRIGQKQGEALGFQLLSEALGQDAKLLIRPQVTQPARQTALQR